MIYFFKILCIGSAMMVAASCTPKITKNPDTVTEEITSNTQGEGPALLISFTKGISFNHPSFVIWAEDSIGNFIQTLFITRSVATGIFEHGATEGGKWKPAEKSYPAALPCWSHRVANSHYIPSAKEPVADAYTGPTPLHHFNLTARFDKPVSGTVTIYLEINQTWDWNEYWTNNKFPDDADYKTSCQPALVYKAVVNLSRTDADIPFNPIGHSHYSGKEGSINPDLSTLTTALSIAEKISVRVSK